jgi:hypothetical protein
MPGSNFLSAPLWLVTVLHVVTLSLHFVAMNFLVGGLVIALWGKFTNRWDHPVVQKFIKLFPTAMAATITFGVAPLLFVQLTYHEQVYSAAIVSGWFWLAIIPAVIAAYYFLYAASFAKGGKSPRRGLFLTIALLLLLYVSIVYSSVFSLAERPDRIALYYSGNTSGLHLNPDIGSYIFRWLHMVLGAITVGGFFVGWLGRSHDDAYKVGRAFFLWGMVAASLAGLAYIFTLGNALVPYMRSPAVWWLMIGIILAIGSLHFFFKKQFTRSGVMVFVSLVAMVINRHYVRLIQLDGVWDPADMPVRTDWSIFLVFLVFFVIAVATVWYMLHLYVTDRAGVHNT